MNPTARSSFIVHRSSFIVSYNYPMLPLLLSLLLAATPADAIAAAKAAMAQKQYADAVKILQDALPDAKGNTPALAALHFYSAQALAGLNDEVSTKIELEEFFKLSPQTTGIDGSKYDKQFVRWFQEVRSQDSSTFDKLYPGFEKFTGNGRKKDDFEPEVQLFGIDPASVETFWAKHASFRSEFNRRVMFADETFSTVKTRGALTDRGRVFVLLGPPRMVKDAPLSQREGGSVRLQAPASPGQMKATGGGDSITSATANAYRAMQVDEMNRGIASPDPIVKGLVERWVYPDITFKFITQEGYGDHVMQREFDALKVLSEAAHEPMSK